MQVVIILEYSCTTRYYTSSRNWDFAIKQIRLLKQIFVKIALGVGETLRSGEDPLTFLTTFTFPLTNVSKRKGDITMSWSGSALGTQC